MICFKLFWSFLQVGLFSIGGGYAAIPLIQNQIVEQHSWLTMSEFADLVTIAEMTPGPIAVNSATFVGLRIAGVLGAVIATIGCILPSCIIVSFLVYVYYRYKSASALQGVLSSLRPAVVALIAAAGLSILGQVVFQGTSVQLKNFNLCGLLIFASAFFALRKFKWNPIVVMLLCGVVSLGMSILSKSLV